MSIYREVNEMPNCANCGILIPRGEIDFHHHGQDLLVCSERCKQIYDSYKYPKYREEIEAMEAEGFPGLRLGYKLR